MMINARGYTATCSAPWHLERLPRDWGVRRRARDACHVISLELRKLVLLAASD